VGIDPARVEMTNLSAAEGPKWAEFCARFTEQIRELGPSPLWRAQCQKANKE